MIDSPTGVLGLQVCVAQQFNGSMVQWFNGSMVQWLVLALALEPGGWASK